MSNLIAFLGAEKADSLQGWAAILTGISLVLGVTRVWWKQRQTDVKTEKDRQDLAETRSRIEDHALVKTAVDAYAQQNRSLQDQLNSQRAEQLEDRKRHTQEMGEVRTALAACERRDFEKERRIAQNELEIQQLKAMMGGPT